MSSGGALGRPQMTELASLQALRLCNLEGGPRALSLMMELISLCCSQASALSSASRWARCTR